VAKSVEILAFSSSLRRSTELEVSLVCAETPETAETERPSSDFYFGFFFSLMGPLRPLLLNIFSLSFSFLAGRTMYSRKSLYVRYGGSY
jgi:hypothetical protein